MTETRMKPVAWHSRPRMNRLASVLYPDLADDQAKREMTFFARQERKFSPLEGKLVRDRAYRDQASGKIKTEERRYTNPHWWDEK